MDLQDLIAQFDIEDPVVGTEPFGGGHINDTYRITCEGKRTKRYLLQKINRYVFKDVDGLMRNIRLVTEHIRHKINAR